MASLRTLSAKSTFSTLAFCPMRPILQTLPAVGPKPPAISSLYLEYRPKIRHLSHKMDRLALVYSTQGKTREFLGIFLVESQKLI